MEPSGRNQSQPVANGTRRQPLKQADPQPLAIHGNGSAAPPLRVNAVAPGFFVGEQNRALLLDESGALTTRGARIVAGTPAGRFGEPDELAGTVIWLCSPAASFVTGVVVPVDGGFGFGLQRRLDVVPETLVHPVFLEAESCQATPVQ